MATPSITSDITDNPLSDEQLKALGKSIEKVLRKHFVGLKEIVQQSGNLSKFADHLWQEEIISAGVHQRPSYESIEKELTVPFGLFWNIKDFESKCRVFVEALENLGSTGAATYGQTLREEWRSCVAKITGYRNFLIKTDARGTINRISSISDTSTTSDTALSSTYSTSSIESIIIINPNRRRRSLNLDEDRDVRAILAKLAQIPVLVRDGSLEETARPDCHNWRDLEPCESSVMIISSYSNRRIKETTKLTDKSPNPMPTLARQELALYQKLYTKDRHTQLELVCVDCPCTQLSKSYYLEQIRQFLSGNSRKAAVIVYTGNSEKETGNWCFIDGTITFRNIYDLYRMHYRGKRLTIVSDCSYSGHWITDCIDVLDSEGILSCGHHMRDRDILLKIITSCQADERAKTLAYVKEGILVKDNKVVYWQGKLISSGQTPAVGDFSKIRCSHSAELPCEIQDSSYTWRDKLINGPDILQRLKKTRRQSRTDASSSWYYYVLVDRDKIEEYEALKKFPVSLSNYGKILGSKLDKTAAKEKLKQLQLQYKPIVNQ